MKINFGNQDQQKVFIIALTNREKDPVANIFQSAMAELIKTKSKSSSVQSARVSRVIEISADREIKLIEKHFTFLATVGSTAPIYWFIRNSLGNNEFISINCYFKKYKFSNSCTRNSRSTFCNSA